MSSVGERNLILNLHKRYVDRPPQNDAGEGQRLTIINPSNNPSQRFKDDAEFIHSLFDLYGNDAHSFLRGLPEAAARGFLLWRKTLLLESGDPRYFQLPDVPEIKETFEQYVTSVDESLQDYYTQHNINIPL